MTQETPGQRIERARLRHHWSQEDLAAHLETSRQSIYRWEQDKALPALKIRENLINLLGLPKDIFLSKKEQQTKNHEKASLSAQFTSPRELAAYVQRLSPTMHFKGWRKTKRQEGGLVNLTYVTLNEYPLPLRRQWNNSIVPFDWGYEGSGARSLACSILDAYFAIHKDEAVAEYRHHPDDVEYDFAKEIVERLPLEQWEFSSEQIREWLDQRKRRMNVEP